MALTIQERSLSGGFGASGARRKSEPRAWRTENSMSTISPKLHSRARLNFESFSRSRHALWVIQRSTYALCSQLLCTKTPGCVILHLWFWSSQTDPSLIYGPHKDPQCHAEWQESWGMPQKLRCCEKLRMALLILRFLYFIFCIVFHSVSLFF